MSKVPGSGAQSKACNEIRAVLIVSAGVHSFFKISRQIAPVCELMFGCQILVMNLIYKGIVIKHTTHYAKVDEYILWVV